MMQSTYSKVRSELAEAIKKAADSCDYKTENIENTIDLSKIIGDISCSISFKLAKEYKTSAFDIAKNIESKIAKPDYVEQISAEGGFINFHLNRQAFVKLFLADLESSVADNKKHGTKKGQRVIIEYPSVNPNKPWHIGHLRNALLGDSISRTYKALGFEVEREDYIDDLGLQMAETLWWHFNNRFVDFKPEKKFDHWLGEEYVKVNMHLKDRGVKEEIDSVMGLMGQDGTYESKILRDIAGECIKAQYETAFNFSIYHDFLVWESDIVREQLLEKAIKVLKYFDFIKEPKEGEYANCVVIDLKSIKNLPEEFKGLKEDKKVLIRSNGTPTYLAKDIAFHMWKLGMTADPFKYSVFIQKQPNDQVLYTTSPDGKEMELGKAKIAINIIDVRQSHPQSIIKLIFNAMGKTEQANNIRHLAYGEVELESGALSGRKGTWMGYSADDLLRETQTKAQQLISTKFKYGKAEEEKIIKSVALAAIKFEFLKIGTEKKIIFSWEKALNFEGNSGPYAQYMHARATRIIEQGGVGFLKDAAKSTSNKINDSEFAILKLLSKQQEIVIKAAQELRPNTIADYVIELAHAFATFYESSSILKADSEEEKALRLSLTYAFKEAMKNMLNLLGIDALERM